MSIGYTNPISSSGGKVYAFPRFSMQLGGGIPGFIPQAVQTTNNYDEFAQSGIGHTRCTPFRAVNNAGDLLSRQNYSCGGSCQAFQSRPNQHGIKPLIGHIQDQCDGSGVPPSSCNIKYVYDSSDYSRFLKQKAINKNYNDLSYSGNNNSAGQSAYRAIRRY